MIEAKIYMALKARILNWTETRIKFPNDLFTPNATEPFIMIQNVGLDAGDRGLSGDCGEEYGGFIRASVMYPLDNATVPRPYEQHAGMAGRFAELFKSGDSFEYDDVRVRIPRAPKIVGGTLLDGGFNRIDLNIPWRAWA